MRLITVAPLLFSAALIGCTEDPVEGLPPAADAAKAPEAPKK